MRVNTSKLTPDSVVTYWFHDCERSHRQCDCSAQCGTWVRWSKYSTPRLTARRVPVLCVCVMFEGLAEFCFVFRFGFRASLLDFTPQIERLHVCYYCADVCFSAFLANTVAHVHRQAGQVRSSTACVCRSSHDAWPISCSRWTVAVAALATLRPICRTLCTGASLTKDKLSAVSYDPLSHSRHNAGDRSTKVGHEINMKSHALFRLVSLKGVTTTDARYLCSSWASCFARYRLPVRPSVCQRRMDCDKTEERSVQIFILYERSFSL